MNPKARGYKAARGGVKDVLYSLQKVTTPDSRIRDLLPRTLKDILLGRRSSRVQKTRQFFLKYTDLVYKAPGEELWEDLLKTKRYLEMHVLLYDKNDDHTDNFPLLFYHAEVPEIMLEMILQSFSSDFFIGSAKVRCVPSLAMSVMSYFLFAFSDTFLLVSDRLFRDSFYNIDLVSKGVFSDKLTWFDKLSWVQFFGAASYTRGCIWFFHKHHHVVQELCTLIYRSMEIVNEKIKSHEINWQNENLTCFLMSFRDDDDLELTARLLGIHTTNQAVLFFGNLIDSITSDHDLYITIGAVVIKSGLFKNFPFVIKHLMAWHEPGLYLTPFLLATGMFLSVSKVLDQLLMENLALCIDEKIPLGLETFRFWSHNLKFPCTIAWLLLHTFSHSIKFGAHQCLCILCYALHFGEQSMVDKIVEHYGLDLMDLAHITRNIELEKPVVRLNMQSVVLEALLRYGRVQHKECWDDNCYEGEVKPSGTMKEFVLEAALFCKKAQCEARMSEERKQRLAMEADLVKDEGNIAFKAGNYMEAIMKYTDAIAICPLSARKKQAIYYSNRAECHLRSKNPKRAIHDCNRSLCLDTTAKVKVQWRRSRAYQKLNLDYPAWLDMKCLENEWNLTSEQSGVDFRQLLASLGLQIGVLQSKGLTSIDKRSWNMFKY